MEKNIKNIIITFVLLYTFFLSVYFFTLELKIQRLESNVQNLTELVGKQTDVDKIVYDKMFQLTKASNAYHDILDSMLTHQIKFKRNAH